MGGESLLRFGTFMVSIIPAAAGMVYKQHVLQGQDVDIIYATWWSGNFQVLWGWLSLPLLWIRLPGQDLRPAQTFSALSDTWSCMQGNIPHPGDESCATSPSPLFGFAMYLMFNLGSTVLECWLTKRLSAAWAMLAIVLAQDLTNILGMMPFLAGGGAQCMSLNDWLATALASIALWMYNIEPEQRANNSTTIDRKGACEECTHVQACERDRLAHPVDGLVTK